MVDVKEGIEWVAGSPAQYQHLMFLYKVNNKDNVEAVGYEIKLDNEAKDVIAYGAFRGDTMNNYLNAK